MGGNGAPVRTRMLTLILLKYLYNVSGACAGVLPPAGDAVEPDRRKRKADHHRRDGLERRLPAHADEAAEGEKEDRKFLRRAKLKREQRNERRHQGNYDDGEQGTDEGRG